MANRKVLNGADLPSLLSCNNGLFLRRSLLRLRMQFLKKLIYMSSQTIRSLLLSSWSTNSILGVSIITLMYSVSGFTFFDLYAIRVVVEFISLLFTVIFGYKFFLLGIRKPLGFLAILVGCVCLFMTLHLYELPYIIDAIASFFIIVLINGADIKLTDKLLLYLTRVTTVFCVIGLVLFIIALINPKVVYEIYASKSTHPLSFLGGIIGGYEYFNFIIPRSYSFTKEPSFLAAYMGIPFAFLFYKEGRYFAKSTIFSFLLLSTSGSIYLFFLLSVLSYVMMLFFSKKIFTVLLICAVPLYFYFLITYVTPFEPIVDNADQTYGEVMESSKEFTEATYLRERSVSFAIRSGTISWSLQSALQHPFGVSGTLSSVNGLIIYSFVTAGIAGLLFVMLCYKHLLDKLYSFFYSSKDSLRLRLVASLLGGLLIQAFMFNDYGYTTVHGMPLLALALKKISSVTDC